MQYSLDGLPPVESLQQKFKLRIRQGHHPTFRAARHSDLVPTAWQTGTFRQAHSAVAPIQVLEQITTFASEDERVAREWVFLQDRLHT